MIRLFVNLHGGASYSRGPEAEEFSSLRSAEREYERRRFDSYYPCWGDPAANDMTNDGRFSAGLAWYVNDDHESVQINPITGEVWLDSTDMYPDRELTVGPRGGLRWEPC